MDYSGVTEATGIYVTREALAMMYTRYRYAAEFCHGKDVLEVACGSGGGLGYLARSARKVIGGDYTESLVRGANRHYRNRIALLRFDAQTLPFRPANFDVVVLYEAIYYLPDPARFMDECRRVLRPRGTLLICTVNKELPDFSPSAHSTRYFAVAELSKLLRGHQFDTQLFGAFSISNQSLTHQAVSWIKRCAGKLNLIPQTMKQKEWLKRLFLGPLLQVPPEVRDGVVPYCSPVPLTDDLTVNGYKQVFAVAHPCRMSSSRSNK